MSNNQHDVVIEPPPPGYELQEVRPDGMAAMTSTQSDQAIRMAREYPRSIDRFSKTALSMVGKNQQSAMKCMYALPRKGQTITGASVRMAEIIAYAWTNLATESFVTKIDDRFVTARANVWDLETNVMIGFEVRRRITDRKGNTFSEDLITQHANSAASIAFRNSVLKCVPFAVWEPVFEASKRIAIGEAETLATRRKNMLEYAIKAGVTKERVFAALEVNGIDDIDLEKLFVAGAALSAVKNGEISIDTAFPPIRSYIEDDGKPRNEKLADRLSRFREEASGGAPPKSPQADQSSEAKPEPADGETDRTDDEQAVGGDPPFDPTDLDLPDE
ncbi:MAG: hypothetical protein ACIAQF_10075 [Phycisphaerales bacterium JB065]